LPVDDYFISPAYTDSGYVATTLNPVDKRLVFLNSKGKKGYTTGLTHLNLAGFSKDNRYSIRQTNIQRFAVKLHRNNGAKSRNNDANPGKRRITRLYRWPLFL
jgi:hypothetical protein